MYDVEYQNQRGEWVRIQSFNWDTTAQEWARKLPKCYRTRIVLREFDNGGE